MKRWLVLALLCAGCRTADPAPAQETLAEFGVFYGGQLQQLERIPFELDRSKQSHGFRLTFSRPLARDEVVNWEVNMPAKRGSGSTRRTELGQATIPAGEKQYEKAMHFSPGDPLGLWNMRVVMAGHVLIDRPFEVYDKARLERKMRELDGGPVP